MTAAQPAVRRALRLKQPTRRLRSGAAQLLCVFVGAVLGVAASRITGGPGLPTTRVVDMLLGIGFGVLGVASIIFSLLFLVVQWANSYLSPRLTLFRDDPIAWRTFAYVVGVFVFCVAAALTLGRRENTSVIIPLISFILVLVSLVLIRNLQVRAFASIQLAPTLGAVSARGRQILQTLRDTADDPAPPDLPPLTASVTWPGSVCVLQQLDTRAVLAAAAETGTVVVMRQPIGASLRTGLAIADIHGGALSADTVLSMMLVGDERTFGQDPLLALRLLADIGLRALSSAVNDPATAVQTLDHMHELLADIAGHAAHSGVLTDATGSPRLILNLPTWNDYLVTALADIVALTRTLSPMVVARLMELIDDISARVAPADRDLLDRWRAGLRERTAPSSI